MLDDILINHELIDRIKYYKILDENDVMTSDHFPIQLSLASNGLRNAHTHMFGIPMLLTI